MIKVITPNWWVALRMVKFNEGIAHCISVAGRPAREPIQRYQLLPDNCLAGSVVNSINFDRGLDYDS